MVQSCVVTLAPVRSTLEGAFERQFRVLPARARRAAPDVEPVVNDGDTEMLASGVVDLAAPVLEEFVLAIDPYPRAPGAVFEGPTEDEPEESAAAKPFAALAKLKTKR